jgi:anti-sigma B factor antagonist
MSAMALLSPTVAHRPPTTNEAVTGRCRGALRWTVQPHGNLAHITLVGELDAATAPVLDAHVRPLAAAGRDLVVDLAEIRFCGCAGLTLFMQWQSRAAISGGSLCLLAPARIVQRLLTVTGTLELLTCADRGR